MLERYYNLFDPAQHYSQLLFRSGDGLQSRELNEIQSTLMHRLQGVADALLKDGDIVSGANLQIDADTGLVTRSSARSRSACGCPSILICSASPANPRSSMIRVVARWS